MEGKEICFRQFSRPSSPIPIFIQEINNMGDCYSCKYDPEENKKCALYVPMKSRKKDSELEEKVV